MVLSESVKAVLAAVVLLLLALGYTARRYPHITWLRAFDLQRHLTEEQRARLRRTQNVTTGAEIILLGVAIPLGYFALKAMFLSNPEPTELVIVGVLSGLCVLLGTLAIVRNR